MKCVSCGDYFKRSKHNPTNYCDGCIDAADDVQYDPEFEVEVSQLLNPTGKTQPVFYEDRE